MLRPMFSKSLYVFFKVINKSELVGELEEKNETSFVCFM